MKITNCKTNHLTNPLGYEIDTPTFSYVVEDAEGKFQKEARILISLSEDMVDSIYDSGFLADIDSLAYTVNLPLAPCTRYYWTVAVHSDAEEEAVSSVNWFETGKQEDAWAGNWITCDSTTGRHPIFKKTFSVEKTVQNSRLYICGLGLYEASLDREKIGDEILAPYCNNYDSWLQYQTYELPELSPGEHCLSVLLGNGWYKGRYGLNTTEVPSAEQKTWKLIAELHLTYSDGSSEIISTDATWTVQRSSITASSIYDGETRDDTLPDLPLETAALCSEQMAPLKARLSTPVTIHEQLPTIELIHTPAGETVLDLGQNFAGIFRLRVHEPKGTLIHLQFGEILQHDNFYRDNMHSARAEYLYTSDGDEHILEPHFTFYGYRYVKVTGVSSLSKNDFTGLALYSEIPEAGTLVTGSALVNQLIKNVGWSLRSNFIDIPTDCPQRDERLGWTGDAQVFAPTACYLRDCYAFYRKYLADMASEQEDKNGMVPNVIPDPCDDDTASVWGDAACIIPWTLYQFYGDLSILKERFHDMKAWVDFITRTDQGCGQWREHFHWGDWLALDHPSGEPTQIFGGTDAGFIADVYYMNSAQIVSDSAALLDDSENQKIYQELADTIRARILNEFYSPSGRCCISTQTAFILTLKYHLSADEEKTKKMMRTLFSQKHDKLQTGFVGTPLLCNVLSDFGFTDLAYKLLLGEDYPGWLYAVKMGATTIWERWNSVYPDGSIPHEDMSSLNHYSYGSVVEWIWRHAVGITQDETVPGFRKVRFQPSIHEAMHFAGGTYHSAAGTWALRWDIIDARHLTLKLQVPFGCEAEIKLPFASPDLYTASDNPIFENVLDGICHLTAGSYEITYETTISLVGGLTTNSTVRELKANPQAAAFLMETVPGFDALPADLTESPLRPFLLQYGSFVGITPEMLDELDEKLSQL